ncbi:hypothetical protein [Vallitalea okinawensis]|uniref:hypothetical protein n=1 Tax=Vallitalea okinawensis TaxID=2078660 RepID=UPI000CFD4DC8|nr:hypothetical protein [Vallitalea okinawensis]
MSYKDRHKSDNICERECECTVNSTIEARGSFNLECGECSKIFESDEPVEIWLSVSKDTSSNDCDILVCIELQNGESLVFEIPKNDTFGAANEIIATAKQARKVTIECKSDNLDGGTCTGFWAIAPILRGSEKYHKCECPVETFLRGNSSFAINGGQSQVIFQSGEPSELLMEIDLEPSADECLLTITVELDNCSCLKFLVKGPTSGQSNDVGFYSKNVRKVTVECLTLTSCRGNWLNYVFYRGKELIFDISNQFLTN